LCQASLIVNGSFETPSSSGDILSFPAGATLPGWIVSGDVETVRNNFQGNSYLSYDGVRYLDLDGVHAGAISQSIATTIGTEYTLSFAYANNPYPAATHPASARVLVSGSSTLLDQSITHNTSTTSNADWIFTSLTFTADSTSTSVSFGSLDAQSSIGGISLDAIDVTAGTPEPGTTALMFGGLAALGLAFRRVRLTR
jgi:choice-of-anchor C domain-containing protein